MVIYFTGTLNSYYCAKKIAQAIGDETVNAAEYIKAEKIASLQSEKPWVFVAPTYAWQLPHIFADFIKTGTFSGNSDAYFVMTCGGDIGNAANINRKLCLSKNLSYRGTLEVVMPENYLAMFDVPSEKTSAKIIANAADTLQKGIEAIKSSRNFSERKANIADIAKSSIVNTTFYALFVKSRAFYATDACISCGKCEKGCPTNCISMKDGKPVWGKNCTHCMACICGCPTQAIEYGNKSKGKRRYWCDEA